ncbi:pilus assembly protein PilM [bacterium]|nr:pilus assembly protein PilM [bacterium]
MFGKNTVGIFLGPQGLSIVEAAGKTKDYLYKPYPKDITSPAGVIAPKDNIFNVFLDNEIEIIAFLQRSIRESRINLEKRTVVVCVPSRDLIVRFFEIPPIPRKDIAASISFEIKKYIPFRTEEITYDYQTNSQKNIIEVLFVGIKNEDLGKYNSVISQLKINVSAIEPSQFSLFRLLMIKKIITKKEAVVVVEIERGEGAISIVDNGIPCFSRDIKISTGSQSSDVDIETVSFRIINEIRVSIDYFRRQFLKKGIDRIIILSKEESKELINAFNKELDMPVQRQNPDDIFGIKEEHSLNLAKALGASFRISKPSSLTINLGKRQKITAATLSLSSSQQMISEALEQILDIPKVTIIKVTSFVLVALLAIFILANFRINPFRQKLNSISREAKATLTGDLKGLETETLKSFKNDFKDKLSIYKNTFTKDILISKKLEVLPELIPEGIWLEEIYFDRAKKSLYFRGLVYREDDREAANVPYDFISNLKKSPLFYDKVINITVRSLKSVIQNNYKVIKFELDIKLRT